jgi:predicted dienelactone hydrolase
MTPTPRRNRLVRAAIALLAGTLIVAACSGSDEGSDSGSNATDAPTASVTEPTDATADTSGDTTVGTDTPIDTDPADPSPTETEPPVDTEAPVEDPLTEFEVAEPGPYDVGVQTITITDVERNRPLTVEVWFPVADAGDAPAHEYSFAGTVYPSPTAFAVPASELATDGPFPLVVFSHGSPGIRFLNSTLPEALAGHGYIVVSADHTGNTVLDLFADTLDAREVVAVNRPLDVQKMITAMTDPTEPETAPFAAQVDPARIAVAGHSVGGYTAYSTVAGVTNEVATVPPDPRVGAIVTLAPASGGVTDEMFASITVPALVIAGTEDESTPIDPNVTRAWELSASEPHYRADLVGATHQSFADFCEYQAHLATVPDAVPLIVETVADYGAISCGPDAMPSARAHDLTNTFAIAFLESVFRDGTMIDATTTAIPDDVIFSSK